MYYDPMIAKLVTHARRALEAIDAQAEALDAFYIDGIQHNIPFLTALMQHPRWREGELSTGFIAEEYPDGFKPRAPEGEELKVMAAVAAAIDHLSNPRREITQQMDGQPVTFAAHRIVALGKVLQRREGRRRAGRPVTVSLLDRPARSSIRWNSPTGGGRANPVWSGLVRDKDISVQVRRSSTVTTSPIAASSPGAASTPSVRRRWSPLMPEKAAADTSKLLLCPMPGLVKAIHVAEGAEVKAGDALAVVEAMKMENILRAERDGTVKKVNAKAGDSLAVDAVILEFA